MSLKALFQDLFIFVTLINDFEIHLYSLGVFMIPFAADTTVYKFWKSPRSVTESILNWDAMCLSDRVMPSFTHFKVLDQRH